MTLLIDENLPKTLVDWFSGHGLPSMHVSALGFTGRPDTELAVYAAKNGSILLTKDKDFEDLVTRTQGFRVIRLTIGNVRTRDLLIWLEERLPELHAALASNKTLSEL